MSRDFSCPAGTPYKKKADAEAASAGQPVKRCNRCKWWHLDSKRKKGRGR